MLDKLISSVIINNYFKFKNGRKFNCLNEGRVASKKLVMAADFQHD